MIRGWPRALASALLPAALGLSACDSGTPQTAGIDRGGVTTPVTAQGPITGFGSIIVNGVHYDIDHAAITIDGETASGSDLALGQLVTVVGERDATEATGVASTVSFRTDVRGPVADIDVARSELTVLGQRVLVEADTVLDLDGAPQVLGSLARDDVVAVSGFVGSGGLIAATRIEKVASGDYLLVRGTITALNAPALRFSIGSLMVDYSGAVLVEGFPAGAPRVGDRVAVKGTMTSPNGTLVARELRLAEETEREEQGREAEVEGLISRFVSPSDFDVAGRRASANASTVYEGGSAASLALNVKVEVEGTVDSTGAIVARKIEIEDGGEAFGDDD
jgi:hypothetical protein